MRGRNEYLRSARNCLEVLGKLLESSGIIDHVIRTFDESYNGYVSLYQEKWIKNLEELSKDCIEVKELEIVKGEVDMLLKESKEQPEILKRSHELEEGKADKMFIQPILEYCVLMSIYSAFFNIAGEEDMKCYGGRDSISEEEKQEIERLSRQELLKSARDTCSELASKLTENKKGKLVNQEGRESRIKELGRYLFKLERATKLLEEKFEVKETLIERQEKRIEAEREESRQKLRELKERRERDIQIRQEAEQRAEQEAQRAEQAVQKIKRLEQALEQKNLERVAIKVCMSKLARLDEELQDAVNKESEDKIIEAPVSCARGSPEQVIDAIIEEIKINREQIIKEGRVSAEIIEAGVRGFSNQGTSLSDIDVSYGVGAGASRFRFRFISSEKQ